ncbi:MAG TPA: immunoglobulin domain-containing protein, partial [Candidatus Binatia bacterium]|nr:immunoglobulin domain-containing protein [Candidatus Binatia bacterium]
TTPAAIGARGDSSFCSFFGTLDEVSVYNRALSATEIQRIYAANSAGKCVGTIPPIIVTQPTNQTRFSGSNATFVAVAAGSPTLSYQWFFNATNFIAGATNSTLTLSNVTFAQAGSYSLRVTNAFGSILTSNAVLTVNLVCTPPPADLISWWKGDLNGLDSVAHNNAYSMPNISFTSGLVAQAFALNGSNSCVLIPSSDLLNPSGPFSVEVWVQGNPQQYSPDGQFVVVDKSAGWGNADGWLLQGNPDGTVSFGFGIGGPNAGPPGFPVATTLTGILDNRWHHLAGVYTGTQLLIYLDGVLQNTLAVTNVPVGNTRDVEIGRSYSGYAGVPSRFFNGLIDEVSFYGHALTASEVQAIYNAGPAGKCANKIQPVILLQPTNQTHLAGSNVAFVSSLAGSPTLRYQWLFNGTNLVDGGRVNGSLTAKLTLLSLQTNDAGNYQVIVTNAYGSVTSQVAVLIVVLPPQIIVQPTNRAVLVGSNATFAVSATGTAPLAYQWWFNGTNGLPATTALLTITNALFTNIGGYSVVVTNNYARVTSAVANLSVALPPLFQSLKLSNGQLTMTWNGATGFTYQVQYNTDLTQLYWSNLGSPIFATNNIVTGYDTIGPNPQRFYRVSLLP